MEQLGDCSGFKGAQKSKANFHVDLQGFKEEKVGSLEPGFPRKVFQEAKAVLERILGAF